MKFKFGLLPRVVLAIVLGVACGFLLSGAAEISEISINAYPCGIKNGYF